jgi:hypothetical protein
VRRADNLTTFMCRLSCNLGASTSWNPQGLSRPVMGLLYLLPFEKALRRRTTPCTSSTFTHPREVRNRGTGRLFNRQPHIFTLANAVEFHSWRKFELRSLYCRLASIGGPLPSKASWCYGNLELLTREQIFLDRKHHMVHRESIAYTCQFTYSVALRPNAGHGLLILEISRSHTTKHHSR